MGKTGAKASTNKTPMIYLIRHGQTDWNKERRIQGQLDIPLNETGREEAKICAKQLAPLKIDRIISSDLLRARETAQIINKFLSRPISIDSRLREVNCGDLQGVWVKDISPETWDIFNHTPYQIHAESLADVYRRVKSFFAEFEIPSNILIITHGGVIRMTKYLANHPRSFNQSKFEAEALSFKIKNTEIFSWNQKSSFQSLLSKPS